MPMPQGTFNNKLSEKLTQYNFTEAETERLKEILRDMAADIDNTCESTSFNKALKAILK